MHGTARGRARRGTRAAGRRARPGCRRDAPRKPSCRPRAKRDCGRSCPTRSKTASPTTSRRSSFAVGRATKAGGVVGDGRGARALDEWLAALRDAGLVPKRCARRPKACPEVTGHARLVIRGAAYLWAARGPAPLVLEGSGWQRRSRCSGSRRRSWIPPSRTSWSAGESCRPRHVLVYADAAGHARFPDRARSAGRGRREHEVKVRPTARSRAWPRRSRSGPGPICYRARMRRRQLDRTCEAVARRSGAAGRGRAARRVGAGVRVLVAAARRTRRSKDASHGRVRARRLRPHGSRASAEVQRRLRAAGARARAANVSRDARGRRRGARPNTTIDALSYRNQHHGSAAVRADVAGARHVRARC